MENELRDHMIINFDNNVLSTGDGRSQARIYPTSKFISSQQQQQQQQQQVQQQSNKKRKEEYRLIQLNSDGTQLPKKERQKKRQSNSSEYDGTQPLKKEKRKKGQSNSEFRVRWRESNALSSSNLEQRRRQQQQSLDDSSIHSSSSSSPRSSSDDHYHHHINIVPGFNRRIRSTYGERVEQTEGIFVHSHIGRSSFKNIPPSLEDKLYNTETFYKETLSYLNSLPSSNVNKDQADALNNDDDDISFLYDTDDDGDLYDDNDDEKELKSKIFVIRNRRAKNQRVAKRNEAQIMLDLINTLPNKDQIPTSGELRNRKSIQTRNEIIFDEAIQYIKHSENKINQLTDFIDDEKKFFQTKESELLNELLYWKNKLENMESKNSRLQSIIQYES